MAWIKNWFSNMLPMDDPYLYGGVWYRTVENFYQAMKLPANRNDLRAEIAAMSPWEAKRAIKNRSKYLWRKDWNEELSLKVMEFILRIKFKPGTSWYNKLMATGNEDIVELNNWHDTFWGREYDTGVGENYLGLILMKIRNEHNKTKQHEH